MRHMPMRFAVSLPNHKVICVGNEHGFSLSGIPLGGDQYIISKLQEKLDKTREVIANICKLKNYTREVNSSPAVHSRRNPASTGSCSDWFVTQFCAAT